MNYHTEGDNLIFTNPTLAYTGGNGRGMAPGSSEVTFRPQDKEAARKVIALLQLVNDDIDIAMTEYALREWLLSQGEPIEHNNDHDNEHDNDDDESNL
jgi:hypothetical protein